jgi:hypothetical protein
VSAAGNIYGAENDLQEAASCIYKPSAWQTEYHTCPADFLLGAGAAGVGKTLALIMEPLKQLIVEHQRCSDRRHPYPLRWGRSAGWALHLRRELQQLQQTVETTHRIYPEIDKKADFSVKTNTWTFASGFKVQFGHCKDPNDHEQYLSSAYTLLLPDELTQFEKKQIDGLRSRVRSTDPVLRPMLGVRSMSNPGKSPGADPDWVRKMFIDPHPAGRKMLVRWGTRRDNTRFKRTHMYLPGRLSDNPNREYASDYEASLLDLPEHIIRAYLDGDWYYQVGAFFGNVWDARLHVVKPFRIPSHWRVFRSCDWGYRLPGCIHWWAIDDDGGLIAFDELKFQEMTDAQVAARVKQIEIRHGLWDKRENKSMISGPADTQLWEQRGDSAKRKVDVFQEAGIIWHQADKSPGSRAHHAQRITKLLKSHQGGTRLPGLMFMANCVYAISTIPQLMADEDKPEEPLKSDIDHAYDSVCYGVAWASQGAAGDVVRGERAAADELDKVFDEPKSAGVTSGKGASGIHC